MGSITAIAGRLWMMSFQACALILMVLAVRIFLKKFPKSYSCFLWALVGVRLLCPVFVEASFSLQPEIWDFSGAIQQQDNLKPSDEAQPLENSRNTALGSSKGLSAAGKEPGNPNEMLPEARQEESWKAEGRPEEPDTYARAKVAAGMQLSDRAAVPPYNDMEEQKDLQNAGNPQISENPRIPEDEKESMHSYSLLAILYLAGVAAAFGVYFAQYLWVKRRIRMAVREEGNIWLSEKISTPFVLGMIRPRIFLPFTLKAEEKFYILKHEKIHIKHRDPLFRFFGILCICLHWWNPLVWLAVHRMNQDMEMYCDEAVLHGATAEEKKTYARTLLCFAQKQSGLAVALAFGESNTERRVKNIMYKRKGSIVIIGIVVLLSVFCIATLMTIPGSAEGKEKFSIEEDQKAPEDGMADAQDPLEDTGGMQNLPEGTEGIQDLPEGNKTESRGNRPEENGSEGKQNQPNGSSLEKSNTANDGKNQDSYLYTKSLSLEPYGEVIFAVAPPNPDAGSYADMAFYLLQEGEKVYTFLPNGKEIRKDEREFQRLSEVQLQDINKDNIPDLITIAEYCWEASEWSEACIYTGTEDGKFMEEIYLEEAYNQSHKEKSISELLGFLEENRDYYIYSSIYGNWRITEYIHPEEFGGAVKTAALSEEEIQSLVGTELEYGRYYYTLGQKSYLVESYHKELITAREFDEQMGVTTEELGLAAIGLNYYELEGLADKPFGSRFYQIDAENALIFHQGAFFRAVRKAEAVRSIHFTGNAEDKKEPATAKNEAQSTENPLSPREQMISAYIAALEKLYENQILPNGEQRALWDSDRIEDNRFALYDIDSDGVEELIIQYTTTYVAGQTEAVYHYDPATGTLREELLVYPSLSYYSNGTVKANLSHNHGMAAGGEQDFWPYQLYCYNPTSGVYEQQAAVDAWDKTVREQDWEGNTFPDELDLDKDGILYSCSRLNGLSADESEEELLVDGKEYEEWLNTYLGDAKLLSIPYVYLTKDNIHALQ